MSHTDSGQHPDSNKQTTDRNKPGDIFPEAASLTTIQVAELLQNLRVHQEELEQQNEELRKTQEDLQKSQASYISLYDFAPVGYFTLDKGNIIIEANLTGAKMLGVERQHLLNTALSKYIPDDWENFYFCLKQAGESGDLASCELKMRKQDGTTFYADIRVEQESPVGPEPRFRFAVVDVTQRKLVELTLKESERKYRDLADSLAEGIFETDSKGIITYANNKALAYMGVAAEDLKKELNVFDFVADDYQNFALERFNRVLKGEVLGSEDYVVRKTDGSTFPVLISSKAIGRGEQKGIRGVFIDMTESKQREAKIARLASFPELNPNPILEVDRDGKITYINPAAKALFPNLQETGNKHPFLTGWQGIAAEIRSKKTILKREINVSERWYLQSISSVPSSESLRVYSIDITERKLAEQKLQEGEEKYRSLFQNISNGYAFCQMMFDQSNRPVDFTYLEVNDAFERLTGLKKIDVIGKNVTEAIPGIVETNPEVINIYGKVALTGEPATFEVDFHPLQRWLAVTAYRPKEGYFVAIFDDITERKKMEQAIKEYSAKLETANEELQQFAYVASHDLREPLRMMTSFSQSLEKKYKDKLDTTAIEYIGFIVDAARRMQNLIDDILIYSRVGTRGVPFQQVDMQNVLKDTLLNLKMSIDETTAKVTYDPLPVINADPNQMGQVLQNLIANAIKFRRDGEIPTIQVSATQGNNEWQFSVKDNGIGIPRELFGRLFVLFSRLHPPDQYPGTGIGLAVAKRIIQRHGGRIWVESQPGMGSTFYFTVPVTKPSD